MRTSVIVVVAAVSVLASSLWAGGSFPVFTDFNCDSAGLPPAIGGPMQPTQLIADPNGTVLVETTALGLTDQPVVMSLVQGARTGLQWDFPAIEQGTIEVTFEVALDRSRHAILMEALDGINVRLRLTTDSAGTLFANGLCPSALVVGSYAPNTPFAARIRMTPPDAYAVTIDPELDGFDDNIDTTGPYCQTGAVGSVALEAFLLGPAGDLVTAFDNVRITTIPIFADGFEAGDTTAWSATSSAVPLRAQERRGFRWRK